MTLDSGADVSVAPEEFYNVGQPGGRKTIQMVDAHGEIFHSRGNRRLRLKASFGRLLKQGWTVLSRDDDGILL